MMTNEDMGLVWKHFLKAAKLGTREDAPHSYKMILCKTALKLSDKLVDSGYNCGDPFYIWCEYIGRVFNVVEGDTELVQRIVREYFLCIHSGGGLDFSISFTEDDEGSSLGHICDVKFSGIDRRFYIKWHQRGLQYSNSSWLYSDVHKPLIQEIFVYKLLSLIKVGGEVHFPFPISFELKKALMIATEKIDFTSVKKLTFETANPNAMILVCFLQYILRLEDIGENGKSFGQTNEGKPVIVDFWFLPRSEYVLSDGQIYDFWQELRNCNYRLVSDVLKSVTKEKRKEVIHEAVEEWNLLDKIDEAKSFVDEFVAKSREKLEVIGDLNRYVYDVKTNVGKMLE